MQQHDPQPFEIRIDDEALSETARRLRETRWLDDAVAASPGYGTTTTDLRKDVAHWLDAFDWRAIEARINDQPNYLVEIDGLAIHTIHRRSSHEEAIPLILIHGWPTSFLEFLDVCEALAEPDDGSQAFHVVIPSLPGYGFSQGRAGISPRKIAAMFAELMTRLGHDRFLVQGGNWGATIGTQMARDYPDRVIGLHLNCVNGSPPPEPVSLSSEDQAIADTYTGLLSAPHFNLYAQTPFTLAHALNDSPAGTLAWVGEKLREWADPNQPDNPGLSHDWIVATAALYWLTGTAASSAMLYAEAARDPAPEQFVEVPTAVAHFAGEIVMIPRPWAERHYNIVRWSAIDRGGHYPATEVPDLFVRDVREFASEVCGAANPR